MPGLFRLGLHAGAAACDIGAHGLLVLAQTARQELPTSLVRGTRYVAATFLRVIADILSALSGYCRHGFIGELNIPKHELQRRPPPAPARAADTTSQLSTSLTIESLQSNISDHAEHMTMGFCSVKTYTAGQMDSIDSHEKTTDDDLDSETLSDTYKNGDDADENRASLIGDTRTPSITEDAKENDEDADEDDEDEDEDELADFRDTLAALKYDAIPQMCAKVRHDYHRNSDSPTTQEKAQESPLPTVMEPSFGGFNIVYPIRFDDGIMWALKIPSCGTDAEWDEQAKQAMHSEVNTMLMLSRETSIPIPEVFAYDMTLTNDIGCAYVLMQFVEGKQLSELWHNKTSGFDLQQFRRNVLHDVANAMAQLERYSSDSSGHPVFDDNGHIIGTTYTVHEDADATRHRAFFGDGVIEPVLFDMPTTTDPEEYFFQLIDHIWPEKSSIVGEKDIDVCIMWLIRKLMEWTPQPDDSRKKFVLTHPDFSFQNMIVTEDGHLRALIDWDGVHFTTRNLGYEEQPYFLTRDWDASCYHWSEDMEHGIKGIGMWEDSPATLDLHRAEYASFMHSALSQLRQESNGLDHVFPGRQVLPFHTTNSKIVQNLHIASDDIFHARPMLQHLLRKLEKVRETRIAGAAANGEFDHEDTEHGSDDDEDDDLESDDGDDDLENDSEDDETLSEDDIDDEDDSDSEDDEGDDSVFDDTDSDSALTAPSSRPSPPPPVKAIPEQGYYDLFKLHWKLQDGKAMGLLLAELKADYQSLFKFD